MVLTCSIIKPCNYLQMARYLRSYCRTPHSLSLEASYCSLRPCRPWSTSMLRPSCALDNKTIWRKSSSTTHYNYKRNMSQLTHVTCDSDFVFRQLLEHKSFTLTYLLADKESKDAILIDPVIDTVDRDIRIITELGLNLKFAMNTHVHADHITGTGMLKKKIQGCKSVLAAVSGGKADVFLKEGDFVNFGKFKIEAKSTPGHTNGCMTFVWHEKGMVFTGDAVLIRGCGRTDFQEGNPGTLYESVYTNIFSLPDNFLIYPAHDYTGQTVSSVGEEKAYNPRLKQSKEKFVDIMNNLKLAYPKQIDTALPANLVCGVFDDLQPE